MIALFFDHVDRARRLGARLRAPWYTVDGPFRVFGGYIAEHEARLYAVDSQSEGAYAAARLAARRGAGALIPIVSAMASESTAQRRDWQLGALVPIRSIRNLDGLAPLLRLLPDSAGEFPVDPQPLMPAEPVWKVDGEGFACGTLPWATRCPLLVDWLAREHRIGLLDLQLAGYAAAADELQIPLRPVAVVSSILGEQGLLAASSLVVERAVDEALEGLVS